MNCHLFLEIFQHSRMCNPFHILFQMLKTSSARCIRIPLLWTIRILDHSRNYDLRIEHVSRNVWLWCWREVDLRKLSILRNYHLVGEKIWKLKNGFFTGRMVGWKSFLLHGRIRFENHVELIGRRDDRMRWFWTAIPTDHQGICRITVVNSYVIVGAILMSFYFKCIESLERIRVV